MVHLYEMDTYQLIKFITKNLVQTINLSFNLVVIGSTMISNELKYRLLLVNHRNPWRIVKYLDNL